MNIGDHVMVECMNKDGSKFMREFVIVSRAKHHNMWTIRSAGGTPSYSYPEFEKLLIPIDERSPND